MLGSFFEIFSASPSVPGWQLQSRSPTISKTPRIYLYLFPSVVCEFPDVGTSIPQIILASDALGESSPV